LEEGKKLVLIAGLQCFLPTFRVFLLEHFAPNGNTTLSLENPVTCTPATSLANCTVLLKTPSSSYLSVTISTILESDK
jgi:hypothetical protein